MDRPNRSGHIQTVAQRGGYAGVTLFLDVDDFHEGSRDTQVWSMDGKSIFFTAQRKKAVELLEISPGNEEKQLTQPHQGESRYHPPPLRMAIGSFTVDTARASGISTSSISKPVWKYA